MPQTRINGLIHLTRTAFAHLTDNLVTLVNKRAWRKHGGFVSYECGGNGWRLAVWPSTDDSTCMASLGAETLHAMHRNARIDVGNWDK